MKTQLDKLLDSRIEELKATHIGIDSFVLLWVVGKRREIWGLTNSGEFDLCPSLDNIKMRSAGDMVKELMNYRHVSGDNWMSVPLIIHAKSYRDILIYKTENDRQNIDELWQRLTHYETEYAR